MWIRLIVFAMVGLAVFKSIADAFPTGAGGCSEGGPSVGGPHLTATSILKPSDLAAGKFDLSVNGISMVDGIPPERFEADTDLTIEISSNLHSFKGALLRVHSETGSLSFEPGQNAGIAFACDIHDGVEGITHTNARDKETMNGILRVSNGVERVKLDVTLVIASNEILSLFLYEGFDLHFTNTATESLAPTTGSAPSSLPLAAPTIAPSMPKSPIAAPTILSSESNETSSPMTTANVTSTPTEVPSTSQTSAPSLSPSKSNAIGSAEEPTTGSATSDVTKIQHVVTNIQMDLPNVTDVTIDETLRWEELTRMLFSWYFDDNGPIKLTWTKITLRSSVPVQLDGEYEFALRLLYDQTLEYEEDESLELTPAELVVLPFKDPEWRKAYALLLSGDPVFLQNFVDIGDSIDVPVILGSPEEQTSSRRLTNGLVWMVVAICFSLGMYVCYKLLINNRGGLKIQDFAPDTFSFIGSETSRRFGDAA